MPGALVAIEHASGVQREPSFLLSEANQFVFRGAHEIQLGGSKWAGLTILAKDCIGFACSN
jgi:hypothetical protein